MGKQFKKEKFGSFDEFIENFEKPSFLDDITREDNRYYLLPKQVKEVKDKISRSTFSAGLFLGEKKKGVFTPSIALVELLSKEKQSKIPTIILDKKSAWLFICGRDIFKQSLREEDKSIKEGLVFISNETNENLGIGRVQGKFVVNILDKGDFLRREK